LKGGEHGKVVVAGNAGESTLFSRLILPEEDDEHMPPKGKLQLTENEVRLIGWWLDAGGDFSGKVAEIEKDEDARVLLADFTEEMDSKQEESETEIPTAKVDPPNPKVLRELQDLGVAITPLTVDSTFVGANMINFKDFDDQQMNLLLKLKEPAASPCLWPEPELKRDLHLVKLTNLDIIL
jgi:hypothetical protein